MHPDDFEVFLARGNEIDSSRVPLDVDEAELLDCVVLADPSVPRGAYRFDRSVAVGQQPPAEPTIRPADAYLDGDPVDAENARIAGAVVRAAALGLFDPSVATPGLEQAKAEVRDLIAGRCPSCPGRDGEHKLSCVTQGRVVLPATAGEDGRVRVTVPEQHAPAARVRVFPPPIDAPALTCGFGECEEGATSWIIRCARHAVDPAAPDPSPIPIVLHCPECRTRHIDEGEFATKPHHTHSCQSCGLTWRPAVVPTVGVRFLPGFKNGDKTSGVATPRQEPDILDKTGALADGVQESAGESASPERARGVSPSSAASDRVALGPAGRPEEGAHDHHRDADPPPWRWRVGTKLGRTLYYGDILHGLIDTPAVAARVAEAMNEIEPLRKSAQDARDIIDELVAEAFGVTDGVVPGRTAAEGILQIRALRKVAEAAIVYMAARDAGGADCWWERQALRDAVEALESVESTGAGEGTR